MIEITGVDLVAFAKAAYELSQPQGMGWLHARPGPLDDATAEDLVRRCASGSVALHMDYVHGRSCKMVVFREDDGRLMISDSWYDHTDALKGDGVKLTEPGSPITEFACGGEIEDSCPEGGRHDDSKTVPLYDGLGESLACAKCGSLVMDRDLMRLL